MGRPKRITGVMDTETYDEAIYIGDELFRKTHTVFFHDVVAAGGRAPCIVDQMEVTLPEDMDFPTSLTKAREYSCT